MLTNGLVPGTFLQHRFQNWSSWTFWIQSSKQLRYITIIGVAIKVPNIHSNQTRMEMGCQSGMTAHQFSNEQQGNSTLIPSRVTHPGHSTHNLTQREAMNHQAKVVKSCSPPPSTALAQGKCSEQLLRTIEIILPHSILNALLHLALFNSVQRVNSFLFSVYQISVILNQAWIMV